MPVATDRLPSMTLSGDMAAVTEHLCHAAAQSALLHPNPPIGLFDWTGRRRALAPMLAHLHGIAPLLVTASGQFPPRLASIFTRHRQLSAARAQRLLALRDAFVLVSRDCGASPIALKGARTLDTLYADPSLRPMADLDFLCAPGDLEACRMAATRLGLVALGGNARHAVFGDSGARVVAMLAEDPDNPIKLEVHTRLAETFFGDNVDVTSALVAPGGPPGHAMNALLHASHHAYTRTLRFGQIVDLGLILSGFDAAAWRALMDALRTWCAWWAYAPLALAAAYFPGAVNPATLAEARLTAPALARRATWRISDVSYSAIGDGGVRVRLRWARRPLRAFGLLARNALAWRRRREEDGADALAPAFRIGERGRAGRIAAWLVGSGIRPVSARLLQLALAPEESPE